MKKTKVLRTLCVVVLLLLLFPACQGRELPPYLRHPETTAAATTTTSQPIQLTTVCTSTTTASRPEPLDPDSTMTLEEYFSQERDASSENRGVDSEYRLFVYRTPEDLGKGVVVPEGLHVGSIYLYNETTKEFYLLRDCFSAENSLFKYGEYVYVSVDKEVYRYKYDGTDETWIYTAEKPILCISGDHCMLFFATEDGAFSYFRPSEILSNLGVLPEEGVMYTVGMNTNYYYSFSVYRSSGSLGIYIYLPLEQKWFKREAMYDLYGEEPITDEEINDFRQWLYAYGKTA